MAVEMDGVGYVSGGRGNGSGCGAGDAGAERRAGRRRGGGGAAGPPRALASHKSESARTCKGKRVRGARAASTGTGTIVDSLLSGPPPWGPAGGDGRASGAGIGPGLGTRLWRAQKLTKKNMLTSFRPGLRDLRSAGSLPGVSATVVLAQGVRMGRELARTWSIHPFCPL